MLIDLSHQPPTIVLVTFEFEGGNRSLDDDIPLPCPTMDGHRRLVVVNHEEQPVVAEGARHEFLEDIDPGHMLHSDAAERCVIAHRKAVANYNGGAMVSPCEANITPQVHNVVGIRGYNQLGPLRPKVDDLSADVLRTSFGDAQAEDPWSRLGMTSHLLLRQDRLARSANIRPDRQRKC
jgi:hypothetical protein